MYRKYIKRWMDFVLSLIAIICLSPILLVTAILIRVKLGSPVLFRQKRPGKDEKIFELYKFRTMTDEQDVEGNLLPDEKRLTAFGKKLRSTSIDELPELFNILKGDMSIVGPRPQLVQDMIFMKEKHRKRHTIRPGLSGWAQVNGRNAIDWEKKLDLDIEYLKNITFKNDIKIIFITIFKVFQKEGITMECMDTAEDYGDYLLRIGKITKEEYDKKQKESSQYI